MGFVDETANKAKEVLDYAGKKSGELYDLQKLRVNAMSARTRLSKQYEALGRIAYENYRTGDEIGIDFNEIAADITQKTAELKDLEARIAECKGKRVCPVCKATNAKKAVFCNICGQRIVFDNDTVDDQKPE